MKVVMTVRVIIDRGLWEEVCELLKGLNEWAAKGLIDEDDEIVLTEEEAKEIGLL